jgi:hypothetical protein
MNDFPRLQAMGISYARFSRRAAAQATALFEESGSGGTVNCPIYAAAAQ